MSKKIEGKIIGVRFKHNPKVYDFWPCEEEVSLGDGVVVKSSLGNEVATVVNISESGKEQKPTETIIRKVTKEDEEELKMSEKKKEEYLKLFSELIKRYSLQMKPVSVEACIENKLVFVFEADKRIDFRDLAKDLARKTEKQVILKQVGPRDMAREMDGFGPCGQRICCRRFLGPCEGITIELAKAQGLSAKATSKISGCCGRLMCCLKHENTCYKKELETMPRIGEKKKTKDGLGTVISLDPIKRTVKVDLSDGRQLEVEV